MSEVTMTTTQQIAEQLRRDDLPAATLQAMMNSIAARRRVIKARLGEIEGNGTERRAATTAGDATRLAELNREAERLDDETGTLHHCEARVIQLHGAAAEREATESARKARKQLPALIDRTTAALTAYEAARRVLSDAVDAIGSTSRAEKSFVSDEDFEAIVGALFPAALVRGDALRGARHGLRGRICAPPAPVYGDGPPDLAGQIRDVMASPFGRRGS